MENKAEIPGLLGYRVDRLGNVYGKRKPNVPMSAATDKDGYKVLQLTLNGVGKFYKVHRLVAMAFLPNPNNKPAVNHKNGNKADNRVENLEWCTISENTKHSFSNKLQIPPLSKIVLHTNIGVFFDTAREAAECFGYNHSTLKSRLNGNAINDTKLIYA